MVLQPIENQQEVVNWMMQFFTNDQKRLLEKVELCPHSGEWGF
jgi:hypothetical protein